MRQMSEHPDASCIGEDVGGGGSAGPLALAGTGFRAAFEAHRGAVRHTLRRFGVPWADLDDLSQEVFLVFYRRLGDYNPARKLRPWLCGIAMRVATEHRRCARGEPEVRVDSEAVLGAKDSAPLADRRLERAEDYALAVEALGAVERHRRAVLVQHDLDGTGMPDVARALGIPLNTAYSRLRLARGDLGAAARRLRKARR